MKIVTEMKETEVLRRFWSSDWRWHHYQDGSMMVENKTTGKRILIKSVKHQ